MRGEGLLHSNPFFPNSKFALGFNVVCLIAEIVEKLTNLIGNQSPQRTQFLGETGGNELHLGLYCENKKQLTAYFNLDKRPF